VGWGGPGVPDQGVNSFKRGVKRVSKQSHSSRGSIDQKGGERPMAKESVESKRENFGGKDSSPRFCEKREGNDLWLIVREVRNKRLSRL